MPGAARPMGNIGGAVGSGERAGGDTGPCGRVVGGACGESLHRFGAVGFETRLRAQPLARAAGRKAARPFGLVWWVLGERVHIVRPYGVCNRYYRKARRYLLRRVSDLASKFRRQVDARQAERQRMFTAWLKTGGCFQDTFICAGVTAAASEAPS